MHPCQRRNMKDLDENHEKSYFFSPSPFSLSLQTKNVSRSSTDAPVFCIPSIV